MACGCIFCGPVFFLRMVFICIVFYGLFLFRMMGAGDIKLFGILAGFLGIWDGLTVIFTGLFLAACVGGLRLYNAGLLWERLGRLWNFLELIGRNRIVLPYRTDDCEKADSAGEPGTLRLGPWVCFGYLLFLLMRTW